MFPITEKYIEREYTIAGNHLMLTSEHTAKVIEQKARKVLGMLKSGEEHMRGWWREKDFSAVLKEQLITCEMDANSIVAKVYADLLKEE